MCSIPKSEVLRYLGYNGQELSQELNEKIDLLAERAKNICAPKSLHMISEIEVFEEKILLSGTSLILTGKSIHEYMTGAEKCITLACTLGVGFEAELLRLQKTSMTDAVIFDAVGNAFIESFADELEKKLLNPYIESGLFSKYRYSPGYGDLPLSLQRNIIKTLSADKNIGLTVTDTDILIPRKSVTAFIGIFNKPQSKPKSKCEACSAKDFCKMRKDGISCD